MNPLRGSRLVLVALALACESAIPSADPNPPPPPGGPSAILVVGNAGGLNGSERTIRDRLTAAGRSVTIIDDDQLTTPGACDVILLSKTSESVKVAAKLKSVSCGVVFWEDNQQMLQMLATIDNDGSQGTGWHSTRSAVIIDGNAPSELRAGQSGTIAFYASADEVTWAPAGDLPASATVVAMLGDPTNGRTAIYVFDQGDTLADGTRAAGRRVFFGLYDDTFVQLTPAGRVLFDAAVAWAAS